MAQPHSNTPTLPQRIANSPIGRASGVSRDAMIDIQNALVGRYPKCWSWREMVTDATEDLLMHVELPDDPLEAFSIVVYDVATVAGYCLAVTTPKNAAEVDTWPDRALAMMDMPNWTYHNLVVEDMKAKAEGKVRPDGWRAPNLKMRLKRCYLALTGAW